MLLSVEGAPDGAKAAEDKFGGGTVIGAFVKVVSALDGGRGGSTGGGA